MTDNALKVSYLRPTGDCTGFDVEYDGEGRMTALRSPSDPIGMNWAASRDVNHHWMQVTTTLHVTRANPTPLQVSVSREFTDHGTLRESMTFTNPDIHDLYSSGGQIGIYLTLPDYYDAASYTLEHCCHAHLWTFGSSSYVKAVRMGGGDVNLGIVLTKGALDGYGVERDFEQMSNNRGEFLLHPEPMHLRPGESYTLEWELFWFRDDADFTARLRAVEGFVQVHARRFVLLGGEPVDFRAEIGGEKDLREADITVTRDGHAVPFALDGRAVVVHEEPASGRDGTNGKNEKDDADEELRYVIGVNGRDSVAVFRRLPALTTLAERRCRFIAGKQQCGDEGSHLYGAYLAYDNDTRRQYYGHWNDHNGGRERVGMGALMALELQHRPDKALEESLDRYLDYVLRELFDDETGEVFNDAPRDGSFKRLYNYPWVGVLFLETYHLKHDAEYLRRYVRCMRRYYAEGGDRFYSIGLPMIDSVNALREAGMNDEADEMLADYRRHGDRIASFGRDYPEHEVNYEQSIVGPAAVYMCELYHLTGEARYRDEAIRQLEILSLFNGHQPHYRMHEVALRHWDDYWFGKRQMFGDTFPHYWSSITGVAFAEAEGIDAGYVARAADSLRGSLTLIHGDGSATCAHVFPSEVNGRSAAFDDPRANDQDWALYYALKYAVETED